MIPREILKKIRQIELRTNRLVSETLGGQYHSVFKGQGMNFEEVREYQPGDEVRAIDWNVTARMNHPFVKKFVEERELTLILIVDLSGSGLFGSGEQSKRELAAEIASVLAFSAIRNNDKVGLILFTDEVEKYMPPKKGRRHVLRVIREILFFEPKRTGTNLNHALDFLNRVTSHKAIAVVISDFLDESRPARAGVAVRSAAQGASAGQFLFSLGCFAALRQTNRKHDLVTVHITDRHEMELPALGRLMLEDAETGKIVEVNTSVARHRTAFQERQCRAHAELVRMFRSANIDSIQLLTGEPYGATLGKFFETREKRRLRG
jgi:Mg-chelatase subunit ChlD